MRIPLLVAAVVAAASLGCHSTTTTLAATGDPLRVDIRTNQAKMLKYDKLLDPGEYYWLDGIYQGEQRIADELDFYHVAGDTEKRDAVIKWREQANFGYLMSWSGFAVSLGVLGAGVGMMAAGGAFASDDAAAQLHRRAAGADRARPDGRRRHPPRRRAFRVHLRRAEADHHPRV